MLGVFLFVGGAVWVCFCCRHSPINDMDVRIFLVRVIECMCTQTRPRFILSSERVVGNGVRTHVNSKGEKTLYRRLRGGWNTRRCITVDSEPNTLPTELSRPPHWHDLKMI